MTIDDTLKQLDAEQRIHAENVVANLQLVADFAYGDVALAVVQADGSLQVVADARPNTAVAPIASTRAGKLFSAHDETEAYAALQVGVPAPARHRVARGIKYITTAYGIGEPPFAVVVRDVAEQVTMAPGAMETAFMDSAIALLDVLATGPVLDVRCGEPFSTTRRAGDGVLRVSGSGVIDYASPNAVNIMRSAGVEGALTGMTASALPGGGFGISPVLGTRGGIAIDAEVGDRVLRYRSIALPTGALVLVEDLTEARRREAEIKVKEATIREVHHRVKNNLQTIASLLRIQARRTDSDEARHALAEATERVSSMAVVHDLLAGSDEERIDFVEAARTVGELVRRGLAGDDNAVTVTTTGSTGLVDAHTATSLALVVAELVHNALEHGFADGSTGEVSVAMRRVPGELVLTVRDDGVGLPKGFDRADSANLGLEIVATIVENDLHGTLGLSSARGTTVTVRVPVDDEEQLT